MVSRGKILMIVENQFPIDIRVWQEARSLKNAGYGVSIICIQMDEKEKRTETIEDINVYRIPFARAGKGAVSYVLEYIYFTTLVLIFSLYVRSKEDFDVIHAHNPPDTLFSMGLLFRVLGKKFVFDHHDLSPELYLSRLGRKTTTVSNILAILEKFSCRLSIAVIATNNSYKEVEMNRDRMPESKIFVVRNGPDLKRLKPMEPDKELKASGRHIIGYVGNINPQDGVNLLLLAMNHLVNELGRKDVLLYVIGKGDALSGLKKMNQELGLTSYVKFLGRLPDDEMLRLVTSADICVSPDPSSPLNDVSTWIKVMEYMALKKPIVAFELKETKFSAQEAAVYAKPNDYKDFAKKIAELLDDEDKRRIMGEIGRKRVENELSWNHSEKVLLDMYACIFNR